MTPVEAGIAGALSILGPGGGLWVWLSTRAKARADQPAQMVQAQAALSQALTAQADAFGKTMMQLVAHQQTQIEGLRQEIDRLSHAERRCQADNDQLRSVVDGLVRRLRRAGIDPDPEVRRPNPLPPQPFAELHDGEVTLYQEDLK